MDLHLVPVVTSIFILSLTYFTVLNILLGLCFKFMFLFCFPLFFFTRLKKFFFDAGNMAYVKALVHVPVLPQVWSSMHDNFQNFYDS